MIHSRLFESFLRVLAFAAPFAAFTVFGGCEEKDGGSNRPDTSNITLICPTDLGLTEEDAAKPDWSGAPRLWSVALQGDTVSLTRSGICGDECGFREDLVLLDAGGECPALLSARRIRTEAGSPLGVVSDTVWAEEGELKIQDWEPGTGPVSGELSAEFSLTFYAATAGSR
jgi:hypothetical protein